MNRPDHKYSRLNRKSRRNKADTILNILIGVVIVLIIITASTIFLNSNKPKQADNTETPQSITDDDEIVEDADDAEDADEQTNQDSESDKEQSNAKDENNNNDDNNNNDIDSKKDDENSNAVDEDSNSNDSGVITYESTDEEIIDRTIVDTSWQPIGTVQTGEHVSIYEKNTVDWKEKEEALAYATGLQVDSMISWKIKNGGSAQKSIGIVSSIDKSEKYRVYIEWVNERGWKPTRVDVLNTLDFDY